MSKNAIKNVQKNSKIAIKNVQKCPNLMKFDSNTGLGSLCHPIRESGTGGEEKGLREEIQEQ